MDLFKEPFLVILTVPFKKNVSYRIDTFYVEPLRGTGQIYAELCRGEERGTYLCLNKQYLPGNRRSPSIRTR